jgi:aryl-alcohol dehydrogenase
MEIRAAVVHRAHGPFEIETLHLDTPKSGEVLVRLVGTGICHTDLAVVEQLVPLPMPIVLGHEGAGIVEAVGSDVTGLAAGDHVVIGFGSCGHCSNCAGGHPAYCDNFMALNFSGRRGDGSATLAAPDGSPVSGAFFTQSSFATHTVTPAYNTIKVRRDAPLRLLGGLGCGFMTGAGTVLNSLKPAKGSTIAILGAGAVGFAAMFAARIAGCGRVIAVDRVQSRLNLAAELAGAETVNTTNADLNELFANLGVLNAIIDTTGVPRLIEAALTALAPRGVCTLVGASKEPLLSVNILPMISGREIRGVTEGDSDPASFIPWLVDQFMEGRFPIDRLSRFYPFEQINEAVADGLSGQTIKPVIEF